MYGRYLLAGASLYGAVTATSLPPLVVTPIIDESIDRLDPHQLDPSMSITLLNSGESNKDQLISTKFQMKYPTVALENSDLVKAECHYGSSSIELIFSDSKTFELASTWPEDLVLVTNSHSCNSRTERGVYVANNANLDAAKRSLVLKTTRSSFKQVSETTTIEFNMADMPAEMTPHNEELKRRSITPVQSALTCKTLPTNKKFRCGVYGTLASPATPLPKPAGFSLKTFDDCRNACVTQDACQTFGYKLGKCNLYPKSLVDQGFKRQSQGPMIFYNKRCFNCTFANGLSPKAQALYDELENGLTKDQDGNIVGDLSQFLPKDTIQIPSPSFEPDNAALQTQLENLLTDDGLAPASDLVADSAGALSEADGTDEPEASGIILEQGASDDDSPSTEVKRALPRTSSNQVSRLTKRFDWMDDLVCGDVVTTLCETCEGLCAGYEAGKAIHCFASGKCSPLPEPPKIKYPFSIPYSYESPALKDVLLVPNEGENSITCEDCSFSLSKITFEGEMVVRSDTQDIISSNIRMTQNSVSNLLLRLKSTKAWQGQADVKIATISFPNAELKDVFSITPKIIYGIGANWQTDRAANVVGGATLTLSDVGATVDVLSGRIKDETSWKPQTKLTYPSLASGKTGRVALVPFIRSSLEMSATILGRKFDKLASLTAQHNLGFDTQRLAPVNKLKRDNEIVDTKQFTPNPSKRAPSLFDTIGTRTPICPPGSMQVRTSLQSEYKAVYPPTSQLPSAQLYYSKINLKGQCYDVPKGASALPCADDSPDGECLYTSIYNSTLKQLFTVASPKYCRWVLTNSDGDQYRSPSVKGDTGFLSSVDQCLDYCAFRDRYFTCGQVAWQQEKELCIISSDRLLNEVCSDDTGSHPDDPNAISNSGFTLFSR